MKFGKPENFPIQIEKSKYTGGQLEKTNLNLHTPTCIKPASRSYFSFIYPNNNINFVSVFINTFKITFFSGMVDKNERCVDRQHKVDISVTKQSYT